MQTSSLKFYKTKFLISPTNLKQQKQSKSLNIFLNETISSFPKQTNKYYSIVGDRSFREKMLSQDKKLDISLQQTNNTTNFRNNQTFCKYSSLVQNGLLTHKLSKQKQIDIEKDKKIFTQYKFKQFSDNQIETQLIKTLKKNKNQKMKYDLNFNTVSELYSHPNPEKLELINDNIPDYWKNSLRDNQNRLKRHIKGNTFKKSTAEEMLQTLRGRKMLQNSIPKIKDEFKETICYRKDTKIKRKGFSIKGKSPISFNNKTHIISLQKPLSIQPNFSTYDFEEVHKINYDSKNRWRISEFSANTKNQ